MMTFLEILEMLSPFSLRIHGASAGGMSEVFELTNELFGESVSSISTLQSNIMSEGRDLK